MTGGLFDPLGTAGPAAPTPARRLPAAAMVAGLALAALAVLIAVAIFRDGDDRGVPTVISTIEHVAAPPKPPDPAPAAPAAATAAGQGSGRDEQDVEIQNGVRIIRLRRDRGGASGQSVKVPDGAAPPVPTGR